MNSPEIIRYTGEGYKTVLNSGEWRIGMIRWADRFDPENFTRVERHLLTDEAFILLAGSATLIFGDKDDRFELQPETVYNVPVGEWHHVLLSKDALVMVVEKRGTGLENSEYRPKIG